MAEILEEPWAPAVSEWLDPDELWIAQSNEQTFSCRKRHVGGLSGPLMHILTSDRNQLHGTFATIRQRLETNRPRALRALFFAAMDYPQGDVAVMLGISVRAVQRLLVECEAAGLPSWRLTRPLPSTEQKLTMDERRLTGKVKSGYTLEYIAKDFGWPLDRVEKTLIRATRKAEYLDVMDSPNYC